MYKISDESYERVNAIREDISCVCDTKNHYEDWEDVARSCFETVLDELDTDQFDMTCATVRECIEECYDSDEINYAKGIREAFLGYLRERRDYLDFIDGYDLPELPEDADDDDRDRYDEEMTAYNEKKAYNDIVEKWINKITAYTLE